MNKFNSKLFVKLISTNLHQFSFYSVKFLSYSLNKNAESKPEKYRITLLKSYQSDNYDRIKSTVHRNSSVISDQSIDDQKNNAGVTWSEQLLLVLTQFKPFFKHYDDLMNDYDDTQNKYEASFHFSGLSVNFKPQIETNLSINNHKKWMIIWIFSKTVMFSKNDVKFNACFHW